MGTPMIEQFLQDTKPSPPAMPSRRIVMPHIPARVVAGLDDPVAIGDRVVSHMAVSTALRDSRGALIPGALAILADWCLGVAVIDSDHPAMLTTHLHLELLEPVPGHSTMLRCSAGLRGIRGTFGLAESTITDENDNMLGYATLGAMLVSAPDQWNTTHNNSPPVAEFEDVDALLQTRVKRTTADGADVSFGASANLANAFGIIHGGIGAMMGARAIDLALGTDGATALCLADLRAVFLRGIPASSGEIDCRVTVLHRGRRLAVARAELLGNDGRVAITVDATYTAG